MEVGHEYYSGSHQLFSAPAVLPAWRKSDCWQKIRFLFSHICHPFRNQSISLRIPPVWNVSLNFHSRIFPWFNATCHLWKLTFVIHRNPRIKRIHHIEYYISTVRLCEDSSRHCSNSPLEKDPLYRVFSPAGANSSSAPPSDIACLSIWIA